MSLINDMLKDLDSRQSKRLRSVDVGDRVYSVRELPQQHSLHWGSALMQLGVTLLVAAGISWWVGRLQAQESVPHPAHAELAVALPPTAVTPTAPAVAVVPVVAAPVAVAPAPDAAATAAATKAKAERALVKAEKAQAAAELAGAKAAAQKALRANNTDAQPKAAAALPAAQQPDKAAAATAPASVKPSPPASKETLGTKAESLFQRALLEQKQGDPEAALKTLREVLLVHAPHTGARLALARMLLERKQATAAADLLGDGLMLTPQHTGLMLALAPLWMQAGQEADAMALLAQGASKSPGADPQLHAFYATQLLRLKRPAEAVAQYRFALRSNADKSEWLLGLGLAQNAAGNVREAITALRRAGETGGLSPQNKTMVEQVVAKLQSTAP